MTFGSGDGSRTSYHIEGYLRDGDFLSKLFSIRSAPDTIEKVSQPSFSAELISIIDCLRKMRVDTVRTGEISVGGFLGVGYSDMDDDCDDAPMRWLVPLSTDAISAIVNAGINVICMKTLS
ncbi:MAG TPA: hypothetical protein VN420_02615 [Candidatus Fimivivens sp.]|nr:hypothetical protein [Candidatus Fimivivens sp.]